MLVDALNFVKDNRGCEVGFYSIETPIVDRVSPLGWKPRLAGDTGAEVTWRVEVHIKPDCDLSIRQQSRYLGRD